MIEVKQQDTHRNSDGLKRVGLAVRDQVCLKYMRHLGMGVANEIK